MIYLEDYDDPYAFLDDAAYESAEFYYSEIVELITDEELSEINEILDELVNHYYFKRSGNASNLRYSKIPDYYLSDEYRKRKEERFKLYDELERDSKNIGVYRGNQIVIACHEKMIKYIDNARKNRHRY